jgi:CO/xanthine dehydrogenase FAD-binding subunit
MIDFEYYAPRSIPEALACLEKYSQEARLLAGGTDLLVQMKDRRIHPSVLIDVKNIPELSRLELDSRGILHIGAAVTLNKIVANHALRKNFGLLHQACSLIGSVQIRNRGTLGGNLCNAAPSADSAPPLLCLGAKALVARAKGTNVIPLNEFFQGPGKTVLDSGAILVEIQIPDPPPFSTGCYVRLTPREEMDIGIVGVASFLVFKPQQERCLEARIALGAVAPTPIRAGAVEMLLKGEILTAGLIEEAACKAMEIIQPISDVRASAQYRLDMVNVLTRRALKTAWGTYRRRARSWGKEK